MKEMLERLLDFTGDGVYSYGYEDGRLLLANRGLMRILDVDGEPEAFIGKRLRDLMIYTEKEGSVRQALQEHGEIHNFEYHFKTLKGEDRWVLHDSFITTDSATGEKRVEAIVKDITSAKRAEAALAAEKERLSVTLRSIGDGVIATDTDGRVVILNRVAEMLTGWTQHQAIGKPLPEVFRIVNEETRVPCEDPAGKILKTGLTIGLANHTVLVSRDGAERAIADSGAPIRDRDSRVIGAVIVFRDISEKRRQDAEFLRIEKLESVGLLAGGIAHDFNNILTAILGNVSLLKSELHDAGAEAAELIDETEKACLRAKDLTQQLLTFSKGGAPVKEASSLDQIIRDSAGFALRGSNVLCEYSLPEDLWFAEIDRSQISQVIQNLVINAQQAMPEGGAVRIRAENIILSAESSPPLPPGPYLQISVIDSGVGIPDKHLRRIFDPYFTTKQKGSGLGLTTTFSIVKRHGGHITVESAVGHGTTFRVLLPAIRGRTADGKDFREVKPLPPSGRVLVMDDEDAVLRVARRMLSGMGFEVETVPDGQTAIRAYELARATQRPFSVVILDLTVPGGIGGAEALRLLRDEDPSIRAIVSSGYSTDPIMSRFRDYGFHGVVTKPYRLEELADVLRNVLSD